MVIGRRKVEGLKSLQRNKDIKQKQVSVEIFFRQMRNLTKVLHSLFLYQQIR